MTSALAPLGVPVYSLAVRKMPRSGQPEELFDYEEISQKAIVSKVKEIMAAESANPRLARNKCRIL